MNAVNRALEYVPGVIHKLHEYGGIPKKWGSLFVAGKLRFLLSTADSVEDVIQEISVLVLEYYGPGPLHGSRVHKLEELGSGVGGPVLAVRALNSALKHTKFDDPPEFPVDPASVPSRIDIGPEPAWSTEIGDRIWDLVSDGKLSAREAKALLRYWDLNNPDDWDILAEQLGLETAAEAKQLVDSASNKVVYHAAV